MQYFTSTITRKQVGVIYSKAKAGELKVERWVMADFYNIAEFDGIDYNGNTSKLECSIQEVLNAIFAGDMEEAQRLIDRYTSKTWELMGRKGKERANRSLVA